MTVANTGQPQTASTQAITALVLGILSATCCQLLAPIALYLGFQERKAIREGRAPFAGDVLALIAIVLGFIGTALLLWILFWVFFAGGLAILQGILASQH